MTLCVVGKRASAFITDLSETDYLIKYCVHVSWVCSVAALIVRLASVRLLPVSSQLSYIIYELTYICGCKYVKFSTAFTAWLAYGISCLGF